MRGFGVLGFSGFWRRRSVGRFRCPPRPPLKTGVAGAALACGTCGRQGREQQRRPLTVAPGWPGGLGGTLPMRPRLAVAHWDSAQAIREAPLPGTISIVCGGIVSPHGERLPAPRPRPPSAFSSSTSTTAEPPKPPPVIRAPSAPLVTAVSTTMSSSAQETS